MVKQSNVKLDYHILRVIGRIAVFYVKIYYHTQIYM